MTAVLPIWLSPEESLDRKAAMFKAMDAGRVGWWYLHQSGKGRWRSGEEWRGGGGQNSAAEMAGLCPGGAGHAGRSFLWGTHTWSPLLKTYLQTAEMGPHPPPLIDEALITRWRSTPFHPVQAVQVATAALEKEVLNLQRWSLYQSVYLLLRYPFL